LCTRLAALGSDAYGVTCCAEPPRRPGLTWVRADLTDPHDVRTAIRDIAPDVVFHLAGSVTGQRSVDQVVPTMTGNLVSTVHLLAAITAAKVRRVVLAGSMEEPDQDIDGPVPGSPYAASKWASSGYARMFHAVYSVPVVTARLTMVYGPGQWDLTKLLPYVITSLFAGTSPAVSSGRRQIDWVFVDDVVEGLLAAASAPGTDGQSLDIGSGMLISIRDTLEQIGRLVGSDLPIRFGAIPDRPIERPRAARTAATRSLTGWSAATPLAEGLRQTVTWYRETWSSLQPS
ncbi:MAG: NAD-dependent epimerase/dehydratase family protein, partial [Gammaproteobacteria bacterium]